MDSEENENDEINIDDAPLSPVLCDSQVNKKIYKQRMRMKSRVKLLHRFMPESCGSKDKLQEDKPSQDVEEESFILSQAENILNSIEMFEKIEDEQCKIQEVSASPYHQKLEAFEFKKPESPPVHSKKLKSSVKQTEFQGFQTAHGRNIVLSNATIEKSKNLFDDILNPVETSDSGRCNKYSFLSKPTIRKSPVFEHSYAKKLEDVPRITNHHSILDENLKNDNNKESIDYHKSNVENTDFGGLKKKSEKESTRATARSIFSEVFVNNAQFSLDSNTFESANKNNIGGFTKDSGKEKLEVVPKVVNQYSILDEYLKNESSNKNKIGGFTKALDKKILEDVPKDSKHSILDENLKNDNNKASIDHHKSKAINTDFGSIKKASGKEIKVSDSALATAKSMFNEEFINNAKFSLNSNTFESSKKTSIGGFTKASGKELKITKSTLEIAKKIFGDELSVEYENSPEDVDLLSSQETNTLFSNLTVIENEALEKNKRLNQSSSNCSKKDFEKNDFKGFTECLIKDSKKTADAFVTFLKKYSERKRNSNKRPLPDFSNSKHQKRFKATPVLKSRNQGLSSASGNVIKISESSLAKAQEIFKEINLNNEVCDYRNSKSLDNSIEYISLNKNIKSGFKTTSGSSCKLSENSLKQVKHLFESATNESPSSSSILANVSFDQTAQETQDSTLNKSQKLQRKKRLGMSACRNPVQISKHKLERAKLMFEDEKTDSPIRSKEQTTIFNSTPLKNNAQKEISIDADITPIKKVTINTSREKSDCMIDGSVVIKACTKGNIDTWCDDLENERKTLELKLKMIVERQDILNLQKSLLNGNCQDRRKKRTGVLFSKKQSVSDKISLKFCKLGISNKFTSITSQNAEFVHFNYEREYAPSVVTEDGAVVIPNARNLIGLSEIEIAFKVMPGIEPKLIPNGWIRNHFKWIVWKLASYERFTTNLSDCLNVENVIQQLKYRYDREIDRAERPTLRKIFEKDDVPQKRMVLCVSQIFHLENDNFELELTDGWYSIRTIIDEPLRSQIYKQKIQIGTKLVICGAELQNCDGCHPLEATDMVRLKIVCNSTRRAVWYARLGYQKFLEPFPLKLRSLYPNGGSVGCVKVCVARVYPVKYLEKQNNLTVWRNRKAEEMRAQDWENERLKRIEEVREVVRRDYERSMQNSEKNVTISVNKDDIENIRCPRTLYNLYQTSRDPESLQERLSHSQRVAIMDYQQQLSFKQQEEMRVRMQESIDQLQMSKRNVTPVLQLLLIDVLDPEEKTCTFHIWRPSETHLQLLTESSVFYIYNVLPKKNGDLTSTIHTKFEPLKDEFPQFQKYKRQLLPIDLTNSSINKPMFGEYDTVGILVQIAINSFNQCFWLADTNERLLFVRVFEGPKNCQLLDNFKCGQVVAVANLKFCDSSLEFGEAIANHSTVISCYPQHKHLQEGINVLNEHLPKDISSFLDRCTRKLTYYIDKVNMLKNYSSSSFIQSNSLNSINVPDDSLEESTLVYSRLTSTDVALSLIDIDKLT